MNIFAALFIALLVLGNPGRSNGTASRFVSAQQPAGQSPELAEATDLTHSAVKLYNEGKYKDALKPAKRALEIRERLLPERDEAVVAALDNLASIYVALGSLKDAEMIYQRMLALEEANGSGESLKAGKALDMLAWVRHARGDVAQAEKDYKRVLAIWEKAVAANSQETAQTLFRLAELYHFKGSFENAQPLYQRLMAFDNELVLGLNTTVWDALHRYDCLLNKMKKEDDLRALRKHFETTRTLLESDPNAPVSQGVLNGKALRLARPAPPPIHIRGTVTVVVTITDKGKVIRACAVSGLSGLWQVAEQAAYSSEFAPTILNGKPVKVTGVIVYNFQ